MAKHVLHYFEGSPPPYVGQQALCGFTVTKGIEIPNVTEKCDICETMADLITAFDAEVSEFIPSEYQEPPF